MATVAEFSRKPRLASRGQRFPLTRLASPAKSTAHVSDPAPPARPIGIEVSLNQASCAAEAAGFCSRRAIGLAAVVFACCVGCGPLGAYNAAHSYLSNHHVFKPVVPDESKEPRSEASPEKQNSPAAREVAR